MIASFTQPQAAARSPFVYRWQASESLREILTYAEQRIQYTINDIAFG